MGPTPPPSGEFTCKGIPYVSGQCVDDPKGIYGSEGACSLSCGGAAPPAPPPAPRPNPFSKECKAMLEKDCGKFTPHGEKTSGTNCNGCISYHSKDIVPLCGGWQPSEGGQVRAASSDPGATASSTKPQTISSPVADSNAIADASSFRLSWWITWCLYRIVPCRPRCSLHILCEELR